MNCWFVVALSCLMLSGCARIQKYNSPEALAANAPKEVPWTVELVVTLTQPVSYRQAMEALAKAGEGIGFIVIPNDWKNNPFGLVKRDSMLCLYCDLGPAASDKQLRDFSMTPGGVFRDQMSRSWNKYGQEIKPVKIVIDPKTEAILDQMKPDDPRLFARYDFNFRPQTTDGLVASVEVVCGSRVQGLMNQISVSQEERYSGLNAVADMYITALRELWPTMQASPVLPTTR